MAAVWPRSSVWPCCPGVHHVSSLLLKAWLFHGVITSLEAFRWLMASGYQIRLQLWAINGALPVGNVEVGVDRDCSGMAGGYPIPGVHRSFYLPHHSSQTAGELEPSLPLPWISILPQANPRVSVTVPMTMEMGRLRSREQYTKSLRNTFQNQSITLHTFFFPSSPCWV